MFFLLCVLQTVFQFEVDQYHFKEALLRFAQFFVAPLLKASSTDRELEAVDSGKYHASFEVQGSIYIVSKSGLAFFFF